MFGQWQKTMILGSKGEDHLPSLSFLPSSNGFREQLKFLVRSESCTWLNLIMQRCRFQGNGDREGFVVGKLSQSNCIVQAMESSILDLADLEAIWTNSLVRRRVLSSSFLDIRAGNFYLRSSSKLSGQEAPWAEQAESCFLINSQLRAPRIAAFFQLWPLQSATYLLPFHQALVAGLVIKELPQLFPILDAPWSLWFQFLLRETTR